MPAEYFEARERALLGERYERLYAAPQETAARGVTVSALRTTPEEFAARADFPLRPSPFCKAAFVVECPDFKPGRHPYHHAGVFYSQEPSASSAAPLLGVRPGMRVLDLCAAPGGKSSQLAAALRGQGLLVSNEYVAARAEILKSNLERMGVPNAVVLNETPARIAAALPEFFDRVLVDAPCSGEGMFRKEPAALAQHCEALVKQCAELGADILDSAAAALAPGGELVYSTCTFAPEEDEGQVAAFLQRHPEFALADVLGHVDYTFGSEGEANRTGGLPLDVSKVRRIWPCPVSYTHLTLPTKRIGGHAPRPACPRRVHAGRAALAGRCRRGRPKGQGRQAPERRQARRCPQRTAGEQPRLPGGRAGPQRPQPGRRGRGGNARPEPRRVAGVRGGIFPGAGRASRRGAWRRRPASGGLPPDESPRPAGGRLCGQRAEGPLRAGAPSVHGLRRALQEPRGADPRRPADRGIPLRPGGRSPHRRRRLVLRDGGRLAAGRRKSVRRQGQKPLPQGAPAAVKRSFWQNRPENQQHKA